MNSPMPVVCHMEQYLQESKKKLLKNQKGFGDGLSTPPLKRAKKPHYLCYCCRFDISGAIVHYNHTHYEPLP